MSYDKYRLMCIKNSNNILDFIKKFTENKMIIIDELHNVISDTYNIDNYINILSFSLKVSQCFSCFSIHSHFWILKSMVLC